MYAMSEILNQCLIFFRLPIYYVVALFVSAIGTRVGGGGGVKDGASEAARKT